jgi:hypothetical protein
MPTLTFEGETHAEIVAKVKRWLASTGGEERVRTPAEAIEASRTVVKDALSLVASAAPEPVAKSDLVKGLTSMGYTVTDATSRALVDSLEGLAQLTGDTFLKRAREASANALFEMNGQMAKQVLKALRNNAKR